MIIEIALLILAVPAGYLVAWMARDELVAGQKWFRGLVVASVALAGLSWLFGALIYVPLALIFIAIASFVSLVKSKDRKWTRKRI